MCSAIHSRNIEVYVTWAKGSNGYIENDSRLDTALRKCIGDDQNKYNERFIIAEQRPNITIPGIGTGYLWDFSPLKKAFERTYYVRLANNEI
jgi:hypothetical protein